MHNRRRDCAFLKSFNKTPKYFDKLSDVLNIIWYPISQTFCYLIDNQNYLRVDLLTGLLSHFLCDVSYWSPSNITAVKSLRHISRLESFLFLLLSCRWMGALKALERDLALYLHTLLWKSLDDFFQRRFRWQFLKVE